MPVTFPRKSPLDVVPATLINDMEVTIEAHDVRFSDLDRLRLAAAPAAALRRFHRAVADVASNPLDILCLGDSITEGANAGTRANRWVAKLRDQLRDLKQPPGVTGGEGYLPSHYVVATIADPFTFTGASAINGSFGLGRRAAFFDAASEQISISVTCTAFDVFWPGGPSVDKMAVTIDGGADQIIDTTVGTVEDGHRTSFTGLSDASHAIVIKQNTGASYATGIMVYRGDETKGIRLWEGGQGSATTATFTDPATPWWIRNVNTIQPDLVLIAFGVNEYFFEHTLATFRTNLDTLIANIRAQCTVAPSIVLVVEPGRGDVALPPIPYDQYVNVIYDAALDDGAVGVCDVHALFGETPWATGVALLDTDKVHPTALGHAVWANAVARYLEP